MTFSALDLFSAFRPRDNQLPREARSQVQVHRFLSLLGVALVVVFGPVYALSNPGAVDPMWARLGIAGLFVFLFGASYTLPWIRQNYVGCLWGVLYMVMGWFVVITTLNQFSGDYAVGLLLVYAVLAGVVAFGTESVRGVLTFLGFGGGLTVLGTIAGPEPQTSPLILLASMGTLALVETTLAQGWLLVQERVREEERLRAAKEAAEEASRLKSVVLTNMSHELRTPLTSIIGFAEAIGDEVEDDGSSVAHCAGLIEKSGHRLLRTFESVLDLSRLEVDREVVAKPIDVAAEARVAADEFREEAAETDVSLHTEGLGTTVLAQGDEEGTRMVLHHLLSNAIKYTEPGGDVWLRVQRSDDAATVEVEDRGIGMDPDEVSDLFKPFRQASEGYGREYEGAGLGLAVTQQAVDRMGGSMDVETEPGEGTCVTVVLPVGPNAGESSST